MADSIDDPEAYSKYGGLDSTAVAKGAPFSAHTLRAITKSANWLKIRGHPLFNLVWPVYTPAEVRTATYETYLTGEWTPLTASMPVIKKPGLNTAAVNLRTSHASGKVVEVKFVSRVNQAESIETENANNIATITGTGSAQWTQLTGIPISDSDYDVIEIYARTSKPYSTGSTLIATATYGSPNTGTIDYMIDSSSFRDLSATWNFASGTKLQGKAVVRFVDGSSNIVASDRLVTGMMGTTTADRLYFKPLSRMEYNAVRVHCTAQGSGGYELHNGLSFEITQIAMIAETRSLP